jgi:hypothetical protein
MSLYLTTTHADVLAAVQRNADGMAEFRERAHAWGAERGSDVVMMNGWGRRRYVTGLPDQPDAAKFGRWTKPNRGSSHPFKDNAAERAALTALQFAAEPIPGLPELAHSASDPMTGQCWVMWPTPFVQHGAAWVEYAHRPESRDLAKIDMTIWSECLGSQFHTAHEAYVAAAKQAGQ